MKRSLTLAAVALSFACGSSPTTPSATPAPTPTTFTLSGQVTSTTGVVLVGATIRIADGPNANRSTSSDGNGNYSLSGLTQSGFTVSTSATNYATTSMGVTLTSNQTVNVQLASLFANMLGAWSGTQTSSGLGQSGSCTLTWLITSQTGGVFAGTYQESGAIGCPQAGSFDGTISTTNAVTYRRTSITVGNGSTCTDSNVVTNGLLSGRTVTIQSSFIRSCTNPTATFAESQTTSITKQ